MFFFVGVVFVLFLVLFLGIDGVGFVRFVFGVLLILGLFLVFGVFFIGILIDELFDIFFLFGILFVFLVIGVIFVGVFIIVFVCICK